MRDDLDLYTDLAALPAPTQPLSEAERRRILGRANAQLAVAAQEPPRRRPRRWAAAVVVAAVCCLGCTAALAAACLLRPQQVAQQLGHDALAAAFAAPNALAIDETQTDAGFTVTLLGVTTAENLTGVWSSEWEDTQPQRSYAVLAVTRTDGTPMAALNSPEDFTASNTLVSPFIAGQDPAFCNVFSMNGARHDIVQGGVCYTLVECDELTAFADGTIYLAVQEGAFYNPAAYRYDAATGAITAAPDFDGLNLLFTLPLDPTGADPARATELLQAWGVPAAAETEPETAAENADAGATVPAPEAGTAQPPDPAKIDRLLDAQPDEIRAGGTLQNEETVPLTDGEHGTGWYAADGSFFSAPWEYEAEEVVGNVGTNNNDYYATLITHHPDDTLTIQAWDVP